MNGGWNKSGGAGKISKINNEGEDDYSVLSSTYCPTTLNLTPPSPATMDISL